MYIQTRDHRDVLLARLVLLQQFGHHLAQGHHTTLTTFESAGRPGVAQHASADAVPFSMVCVQKALSRCLVHHLCEFPSQIHRILDPEVESLATMRGMYMCRIASKQYTAAAVGRRLPRHVGKPGDICGAAKPGVRPVDGDKRLAD